MEKELIESMKNKSREERKAFFEANKSELLSDDLVKVNGGGKSDDGLTNPNSDVPDFANRWWSSFGYVCKGDSWC